MQNLINVTCAQNLGFFNVTPGSTHSNHWALKGLKKGFENCTNTWSAVVSSMRLANYQKNKKLQNTAKNFIWL
jgi:hypothetical protein